MTTDIVDQATLAVARIAFLDETIAFYSEDTSRRAVEFGVCRYETNDGRHCAIGRHLTNYQPHLESEGILLGTNLVQHLPEPVMALGRDFLFRVQRIHDLHEHWDIKDGLTHGGKIAVEKLKREVLANVPL